LNFGNSLAVAETASTFMEDFVLEELLKQADEELKLEIIIQRLGDIVSTIQRQIACYYFEKDLHKNFREKGYLPKKKSDNFFKKICQLIWVIMLSNRQDRKIGGFIGATSVLFFYVYSYASGLLISKSLQKEVKKDLNL
jgi:oligoendopeptidase F